MMSDRVGGSDRRFLGYVFIIGGTIFWGVSAVIAKIIFDRADPTSSAAVDPLMLVQTRVSFSCLVMFIFFAIYDRHVLRMRLRDAQRMVLMGVIGIAGSNITYYIAIQQINVSTAILIQYTAPLFVLAYAAVTKEESLGAAKTIAALLALAGCFFAVGGTELSFGHLSGLGLLAGFGAALSWAFANVYLRHLLRDYSVWTVLLYSFLAASLFWLVVNPPWNIIEAQYSPEQWMQFFGFAIISVLIPHSLYFTGVRYITASRAIITGTFEPIVAITASFMILGEILSPTQILGAVVVIVAIAILQLKKEESDVLTKPGQEEAPS